MGVKVKTSKLILLHKTTDQVKDVREYGRNENCDDFKQTKLLIILKERFANTFLKGKLIFVPTMQGDECHYFFIQRHYFASIHC